MAEAVQSFELLKGLQTLVADRLWADTQIRGSPQIAVIAEDLGNLESEIQKKIGAIGSGGGIVVVGLPTLLPADPRIPDLVGAEIEVECIESAIVNRSESGNKVQDNRLGEIVLSKLHRHQFTTGGWSDLRRSGQSQGQNEAGHLVTSYKFTCQTMLAWEDVPEA